MNHKKAVALILLTPLLMANSPAPSPGVITQTTHEASLLSAEKKPFGKEYRYTYTVENTSQNLYIFSTYFEWGASNSPISATDMVWEIYYPESYQGSYYDLPFKNPIMAPSEKATFVFTISKDIDDFENPHLTCHGYTDKNTLEDSSPIKKGEPAFYDRHTFNDSSTNEYYYSTGIYIEQTHSRYDYLLILNFEYMGVSHRVYTTIYRNDGGGFIIATQSPIEIDQLKITDYLLLAGEYQYHSYINVNWSSFISTGLGIYHSK